MPDFSEAISEEITLYLSPIVNVVLLTAIGYIGITQTNRISREVIVEADSKTDFKQLMSSVLTQAAVVSALLLSIEIPMLQLQVPNGFRDGTLLWDVYFGLCFLSCGFSIQGVITSVLGLIYIRGLSPSDSLFDNKLV